MAEFIRRSYLVVSPLDEPAVERAWTHNADAITLDLHSLPAAQKGRARARIHEQLAGLGRGGAEAFVSISQAHLYADVEVAVWPGLAGLVIAHPERAEQVQEADEAVTELEKRHGVGAGSVEIVVLLGTAKGVLNIREIVTASPRVTTVGLDESQLLMDLGLLPSPEEDPLGFYARGRIVLEAAGGPTELHGHHGVYRLGLGYPLSSFPKLDASADEVRTAAKDGKELGFNGALCWAPEWVEPCNVGFTPTDEEVAYHRSVREAYAAAVAMGRGAMAFEGGKFVERPVDELAKKILALRDQCDQRDAEKAAALERARLPRHAGIAQ
jgi:citrate lyase subunit beta / citryl-CoA lyase